MIGSWWRGVQAWREGSALERRAIPDDLWKRCLVRYPFLRRKDPADAAELRRLTSLFLDRKEFHCVGDLKLTDAMAVAIAAQACLPVLKLGLQRYDSFVGIVVHADAVVAERSNQDEDGVVHEYDEPLSGEAMEGGPVMLSWPDVRRAGQSAAQGYNVVIHEFAHVLDMGTGAANGVPQLPPSIAGAEWSRTLSAEFALLTQRVQDGLPTLLDPYGASAEEEFFAVASECFFVNPAGLQAEHAALYALLSRFYEQDPGVDTPALRRG